MFQKFFTDTYVSKTIKNIIQNTNIYTVPTVRFGDYVVKDCVYIYQYSVIICTKSGKLSKDNFWVMKSVNDKEYIPNINHNNRSTYGFYDTKTHMQLGRYLRQLRDLYGLNLMPYYNCFSYQMETQRHLQLEQSIDEESGRIIQTVELRNYKDTAYKVFLVPIFFDKTYTIAIDSPEMVLMKPVIYDDLGPIANTTGYGKSDYVHSLINTGKKVIITKQDDQEPPVQSQYIRCGSQFNQPFTVNVPIKNLIKINSEYLDSEKYLYKYYNNLYLMIQVDSKNTSSIVVLEGDYTSSGVKTIISTCEEDRKVEPFKYVELPLTQDGLIDIKFIQEEIQKSKTQTPSPLADINKDGILNNQDIIDAEKLNDGEKVYINGIGEVSLEMLTAQVSSKDELNSDMNISYLSKLSLLEYNDGVSYPFSDRLIEYLVDGVVTQYEYLYGNIEKLQQVLPRYKYEIDGIWNPILRQYLYNYYTNKGDYIPMDDDGYLNKDIENLFIKEGKM